ncbi:MAG TPA: hypothetical protein VEB59_05720, partial [Gemmatimonadales bacterium]|nr:hypothetical protein [Gemmatimonadales bacterium]
RVAELEEKLARETHAREQETARLRDTIREVSEQRDQTAASLRSTKGVVTKIKRRVAGGVCPCCNRTFSDLARHMSGKHPGWGNGEEPA